MIVTVFRNRLKAENQETYFATAQRMGELAVQMPGYVSHKTFTAQDGERVTIVEFTDQAGQDVWAKHAEHVDAKKQGRADFYSEYKLQICQTIRETSFKA
jgi:heme-degrading monooxygenase HmoA